MTYWNLVMITLLSSLFLFLQKAAQLFRFLLLFFLELHQNVDEIRNKITYKFSGLMILKDSRMYKTGISATSEQVENNRSNSKQPIKVQC